MLYKITQWCIFQAGGLYKITQWCIFQGGELYNITQWCTFPKGELYSTTELTHELSDVLIVLYEAKVGMLSRLSYILTSQVPQSSGTISISRNLMLGPSWSRTVEIGEGRIRPSNARVVPQWGTSRRRYHLVNSIL